MTAELVEMIQYVEEKWREVEFWKSKGWFLSVRAYVRCDPTTTNEEGSDILCATCKNELRGERLERWRQVYKRKAMSAGGSHKELATHLDRYRVDRLISHQVFVKTPSSMVL